MLEGGVKGEAGSSTHLRLSGLVGHFDIGEALSAARGIGYASDLQQTLPLHGGNEGSSCIPWGCSDLKGNRGTGW